MKRTVWLLVLLLALGLAVPARAEVPSAITVRINGAALAFPVAPRKEEGRVLVPMRAIFEALGAHVEWFGETQSVRATSAGGIEVNLRIGSRVAQADGQVVVLDVPAQLIESSTFVPVRFVAEALGAKVSWEDATSTVLIEPAPAPGRTPRTTAPGSVEQLLDRALPATVLIQGRTSLGGASVATGFFLNDRGLVATNYHVLQGVAVAYIVTYDQKPHAILRVVAANAAADVAVVETEAVGYPALPLALHETVSPGHGVLTVGNPLGLEWSVTEGIISAGDRKLEGFSWIQHTAPISRGNSGGPLISRTTGRVVGMNTFMLTGSGVQNLNFAVPGATIAAVLGGQVTGGSLALPGRVAGPLPPQPGPVPEPAPGPNPAPAPGPVPGPSAEPLPALGPDPETAPTAAGDWPHFLGDSANRSYAATGPGVDLKELWRLNTGVHSARLLLAHGVLFAANTVSPGSIHAFAPDTGKLLWEQRMESTVSAPAAGPHGFYVVSGGWLTLYRADGTRVWRKDLGAGAPTLADGKLFVYGRGKAMALSPETGDELWSTALSGDSATPGLPRLAAGNGRLVVPARGWIHVLESATGRLLYSLQQGTDTHPVVDGGRLYTTAGTYLYAFDLATGKQVWSANVGARIGAALAVAQGLIVVQADDGYTYGYEAASGKEVWSQARARGTGGSATVISEYVYIGGWNGLEVLKAATGEKVTTLLPGTQVMGWVVATPNRLYIANGQWGLYALEKR